MRTVAVIQRILPHYRVAFFRQLRQELERYSVSLKLIYGQEKEGTVPRSAALEEPWAIQVRNKYLTVGNHELVWQPAFTYLVGADCVIIEQANRLLINHYLIALRKVKKRPRLAYWGHGQNLQAKNPRTIGERVKRRLSCHVDWWFAYTKLSSEIVTSAGFSRERITTVQNTIDMREFQMAKEATSWIVSHTLKTSLGIKSNNVGLYCGRIYSDKRITFLLEACLKIKSLLPDFEMVVVGDGPDQHIIERAARTTSWLHYVGPKNGVERVPYFTISKALLMPGMVGLVVVDSFVAGTPLFTTDLPIHSPEIAYLVNGVNGAITANSTDAYASAIVEYMNSETMQARLRGECLASASQYSLENMVKNFATGIRKCLGDLSYD